MAPFKSSQPDFAYGAGEGQGGSFTVPASPSGWGSGSAGGDAGAGGFGHSRLALSVFADRPSVRAMMRNDAQQAGLRVQHIGPLSALVERAGRVQGDIVLVDCPKLNAAGLAALAELDMHAARARMRLIVSVSAQSVDDVFACMDQSRPTLLLDPNRADRLIALGQVMASLPAGKVQELSENDRLILLRLTEQVAQMAGRMEQLDPLGAKATASAGALSGGLKSAPPEERQETSASADFVHQRGVSPAMTARGQTGLPDAKLLRRIIPSALCGRAISGLICLLIQRGI